MDRIGSSLTIIALYQDIELPKIILCGFLYKFRGKKVLFRVNLVNNDRFSVEDYYNTFELFLTDIRHNSRIEIKDE